MAPAMIQPAASVFIQRMLQETSRKVRHCWRNMARGNLNGMKINKQWFSRHFSGGTFLHKFQVCTIFKFNISYEKQPQYIWLIFIATTKLNFLSFTGGWVVSKVGGKWPFGLGLALSGLMTLLTPIAARTNVGMLLYCRIIEGLGQVIIIQIIQYSKIG